MFKIAFQQVFDNFKVNLRKNEGFLTPISCIPIPEYGQSNAPLNKVPFHCFEWTYLACTFCFPISDHVMFPREFSFCFYISYAYICKCRRRHLEGTVSWSNITWSEMGKQNVQAKEVHCFPYFSQSQQTQTS